MSHLKKHGLNSMEDHDLSGLSQSGIVKADIENNSILTTLLGDIGSSAKKITYSGTLTTSLFSSWSNGDCGLAQKTDGSEIFYCYKHDNHVYVVEISFFDEDDSSSSTSTVTATINLDPTRTVDWGESDSIHITVTWNGDPVEAKKGFDFIGGGLPNGWTHTCNANGGAVITSKNLTDNNGQNGLATFTFAVSYDGVQIASKTCEVTLVDKPKAAITANDVTIPYGQSGTASITITYPAGYDGTKDVNLSYTRTPPE